MKLTFLGADREVTGSCTQLEAAGHRFLIDCGMEQGRDVYENADLPCAPGTYEALLLTHAHIDHSGRIPYLYKNGYRGPIYTTDATRDLCAIMLEDSAHIQEQEAEWKNRKAMRSGAEMIEPDYTVEDAQNVMKQFVPCPYEAWQTLFDGPTGKIEMRFTDVGHLLGSASVSLRIAEPGRTPEIIVFSGDIGNTHQPLIKDPSNPGHADYLVMESTYGDRSHGPKPDYIGDLSAVLQSTFDKGGNVVIPSFAVGRTQELLYFIRQIKAEGRIKGHENFPVFVDSPLASKSTTIFRENFAECYDDEALALVQTRELQGVDALFHQLHGGGIEAVQTIFHEYPCGFNGKGAIDVDREVIVSRYQIPFLDFPDEVEHFLCTSYGKGRDHQIAAGIQCFLDFFCQCLHIVRRNCVEPITISAFHDDVVRFRCVAGVVDDGLVDVADVTGKYQFFGHIPLCQPDFHAGGA